LSEMLEIGLEDIFWLSFTTMLSLSFVGILQQVDARISSLTIMTSHITIVNKGLWAIASARPVLTDLSRFKNLGFQVVLSSYDIRVRINGASESFRLPFRASTTTLTSGGYRFTWNGLCLVIENW